MSRNEGRIRVGDEAAVDGGDILAQIGIEVAGLPRPVAVARYLSASDGWKDASAQLRGAFAPSAIDDEE